MKLSRYSRRIRSTVITSRCTGIRDRDGDGSENGGDRSQNTCWNDEVEWNIQQGRYQVDVEERDTDRRRSDESDVGRVFVRDIALRSNWLEEFKGVPPVIIGYFEWILPNG